MDQGNPELPKAVSDEFGRPDLVQYRIHTGDAAPIRESYCPLPPLMYMEMKSILANMLEKTVIRGSRSPWVVPIVLVKKKMVHGDFV